MKTASYTLIPATQFGVATENYDGVSEEFTGVPIKAAAYYLKAKGLQTSSWYIAGFQGKIELEGTLDTNSDSENYFTISSAMIGNIPDAEIQIFPYPTYPPVTENNAENIEGNFTWIRAKVTRFTAGSITKVSLGY